MVQKGLQVLPMVALTLYKMWLLRQAHGMCPKHVERPLRIVDETEGTPFEVTLKHHTKTQELLSAEEHLHGDGYLRGLRDLYGRLHDEYDITRGAICGELFLHQKIKRQRKEYDPQPVLVTVADHSGRPLFEAEVPVGTMVFEVMQKIPNLPQVYYKEIMDDEGNPWRLDERIKAPVNFTK